MHQGALGLPDCLPATVSPPTSHYSATTFFPNQRPKPSTHCAATAESFDQVSGLFSSSLHTSSSLHVHTSVKVEVILQEQFPTTSGLEETAHIPVHRYSNSLALRYSRIQCTQGTYTQVLEVGTQVSTSVQCSVVLATSHHLWPGGNCSWYVCSPARGTATAFSRLFPSFQLSPAIAGR